jgi:hypothetical protein
MIPDRPEITHKGNRRDGQEDNGSLMKQPVIKAGFEIRMQVKSREIPAVDMFIIYGIYHCFLD